MTKGLRERCKAPEADDTAHRLATLSHGLQGAKDLQTTLTEGLEVGTKVKTHKTIIAHVEADLENIPQPPT
jgi:hypothetical protein